MFTVEEWSMLARATTTMQAIVAAMVVGLMTFLGMAVAVAPWKPGPPGPRQTPSLVAAGVLILFLIGGFPTRGRLEDAIEHERQAIAHLRQLG